MKQYQVYLFDFDGTLFDTIQSLYPVYEYGFGAVGMNVTHAECDYFIHISLSQSADYMHMKPEDYPIFRKAIGVGLNLEESLKLITLFDDAIPTVKALRARGAKIGIVSGNNEDHMKIVLERFHVLDLFDEITGNESFKNPKPSAEPCLAAIAKLGRTPSHDILYVGDSLQDVESGLNAKIDGLLVDRSNAYPTYERPKLKSLLDLIK
ncbi:MAG: Phosphoglycolate phosphatase [Tenericutes bacterium ADurb.BinA155]|jgi:phosphoglycolate phosphatase|nr:MAG: Phosphoglycolate phosphatase [Tenericutes bacterium ADurb.BinA155]